MAVRSRGESNDHSDVLSAQSASGVSSAHQSYIFKIGLVRRLLDRYSGPALSDNFDLTHSQWRLIISLYDAPGQTARQLARLIHADKAEISRACAELVDRGYVAREIDANDRRNNPLKLTAKGRKLHDAIIPLRHTLQLELEGAFTPAEAKELHRLLDKMAAYVASQLLKSQTNATARTSVYPPARSTRPV